MYYIHRINKKESSLMVCGENHYKKREGVMIYDIVEVFLFGVVGTSIFCLMIFLLSLIYGDRDSQIGKIMVVTYMVTVPLGICLLLAFIWASVLVKLILILCALALISLYVHILSWHLTKYFRSIQK